MPAVVTGPSVNTMVDPSGDQSPSPEMSEGVSGIDAAAPVAMSMIDRTPEIGLSPPSNVKRWNTSLVPSGDQDGCSGLASVLGPTVVSSLVTVPLARSRIPIQL